MTLCGQRKPSEFASLVFNPNAECAQALTLDEVTSPRDAVRTRCRQHGAPPRTARRGTVVVFCLAGGSLAGRPMRGRLLGRSRGGGGGSLSAAVTGSSLGAAVTRGSLSRRSGLNSSRTRR